MLLDWLNWTSSWKYLASLSFRFIIFASLIRKSALRVRLPAITADSTPDDEREWDIFPKNVRMEKPGSDSLQKSK
jgi:hypothetical protein